MNGSSPLGMARPVVVAPMAGGVSTPALVVAAVDAGGFGYLAAGYQSPQQTEQSIRAVRSLTEKPFGINLFVPQNDPVDRAAVAAYRERLRPEAVRYGVTMPDPPDGDDDSWADKLEVVRDAGIAVVSFTFGCPDRAVIAAVRRAGSLVVVTVTSPDEAAHAAEAGADVLCVQGPAAGGHRGSFAARRPVVGEPGLIDVLHAVRDRVSVPLIAAGGLMDADDLDVVLRAGAVAGQFGTAFLRTPEAGTSAPHRAALADSERGTRVTTAFTGRPARALRNRFIDVYGELAPVGYPHIHHVTRPLRQAAQARADDSAMALWAGTGYPRGRETSTADLLAWLSDPLGRP